MARARKPIASDSPRATMPRTTGRRKMRCRAIGERIGWLTWAISPSGLRTATDQLDGPRIITPSRTACPPTVVKRELAPARAAGALEPALEPLDTSAGIDELLLARVERVAVRADLDVELGPRRPGLERVPAGTRHGCDYVLRVDLRLHRRPG